MVFIRRPITAMVAAIILTIVGFLAIISLPVSQYPDITPPVVQVSGQFIGADAQTVEQTVTTPVETQVNGVTNMAYMQSNSTSNGQMSLNVSFNVGTNIDIAATDVQKQSESCFASTSRRSSQTRIDGTKEKPQYFNAGCYFFPSCHP